MNGQEYTSSRCTVLARTAYSRISASIWTTKRDTYGATKIRATVHHPILSFVNLLEHSPPSDIHLYASVCPGSVIRHCCGPLAGMTIMKCSRPPARPRFASRPQSRGNRWAPLFEHPRDPRLLRHQSAAGATRSHRFSVRGAQSIAAGYCSVLLFANESSKRTRRSSDAGLSLYLKR
ncbi:hypothetical protein GSI_04502 [Ganoderma sinense ZZ0214-1]|uniref:Uncharacterized protein n=1 Tax=Ganoderma sinense ZZ0214-1 TaxID=1077348 RepID=A0A2G8SH14_9APHY|nr:hypothetical protein GSI_04502 [Ganoderma sinense ZZ0214-1]